MGIPAAMSVRECLSRLTNGCRVRIDGARGKIVLLEESLPPATTKTRELVPAG